ncbi:ATP-dependent protease ClpP, protease subunit [Thalassobacillus cyri]|uniref:ATP-dependent Clp protease proteolytic subunit n=1 Tax=Thalassobacillus cyri TaxID=571932 RepID=A0A1H4H352_9BACI|nr:head maturation protease, ClpP-related [Thalassobacillus cyri]SEB15790.1 ATP-dependent protease ClpP, protease subunit [Thalassobacillus cyri]
MTINMNEVMKKYSNMDSRFEVKNEAADKAELFIYGAIGGWFSDVNARHIRRKLDAIDKDHIHVHINSPGGDVFDSVTIHNLLKNHKAEVTVHIDGLAASGASVIAMAGDKVIMPSNTMMMIHNAWTIAMGNAKELHKVADDISKIDAGPVKQSYMKRFIGEESELERLLGEESFLTAEECLALGFADEVVEEIDLEEEEEEPIENAKDEILAKYAVQVKPQNTQEDPQEETPAGHFEKNAKIFENFLNAFTK